MSTRIVTNNHWRQFDCRCDVPQNILDSEFDWTTEDDSDGYFRYKGTWYHLSEFMRTGYPGQVDDNGYHASKGDSYFSGILIRLSDDGEKFQVATYYS